MIHLVLSSARAHWRRFTLTTLAVVLGVSFVVGSFVLTDSLAASINTMLAEATGHTDLVVRPADPGGGGGGGGGGGSRGPGGGGGGGGGLGMGRRPRGAIPADLVTTLGAVPGVAEVDPLVAGAAQLLGKAGAVSRFDIVPLTNWPAHPEMGAVHLRSGRAPRGPDDAVIDTATADDRGLHLGSSIQVGTRRGVVTATVVGLAQRGSGNLGAAGSVLAFTTDRATELVGTADTVDSISIAAAPGTDHDALRQAVAQAAGPTMSVLNADTLVADARARIQTRLSTFNSLMLGFAAVTLFVSAFLIWNTFTMVVAQRRRELALLRAVGATASQVRRSVIGEGAIVGLVSSILGIGAGVLIAVGLRGLLSWFGLDLPSSDLVLAGRSIAVGILTGLGVTVASVIGPATRTTRIPPVAALQAAAVPPATGFRRGAAIGSVVIAVGLLISARGVLGSSMATTGRMGFLAIGAAIVFGGVTVLARHVTATVVGLLSRPFRRFGGVGARLAAENAARDPRRTASTASALMIGLALVATTLVLGDSVKAAYGGSLRASINAGVVVDAGGIVPFDDTALAALRSTPGVRTVTPLPFARANLADVAGRNRIGLTVAAPEHLRGKVDPAFRTGTWPADDRHIAVSASFADEHRLRVGSTVTLRADPTSSAGVGPEGSADTSAASTADTSANRTLIVSGSTSGTNSWTTPSSSRPRSTG